MKRLLPLAAIEVYVWLILLAITLVISKGVLQIDLGMATLMGRVATQIARLSVSAALILIWLIAWKRVTDYYLSRTLSRSSSS